MPKIACPYCFGEFKSSNVLFRCNNTRGHQPQKDETLSAFWGSPHLETPAFEHSSTLNRIMGTAPKKAKCPDCGQDTHKVMCPHCHNLLPRQMVEKRSLIISIVGARSSGKTNYITVLINELRRNCDSLGSLGILPSAVADRKENTTEERYLNDFYNILYRRGQVQAQTQISDPRSKVPLIYEVTQKGKNPIFLVFYDTAGENFHDLAQLEENVQYLRISDATIFLLDTFDIPTVHDRLASKLSLPPLRSEEQYFQILTNVKNFFMERDEKEHFKKPMALVFTKIDAILLNQDLFQDASPANLSLEQNSPFLTGQGVDTDDFESVSDGMEGVLRGPWHGHNFVNSVGCYDNHRFFGISALGASPQGQKVTNLRPYRVLDPLVWILHSLKFSFPMKK